ncbi:MAG: hypothetical protein ACE5Q6_16505, partial [Dehalococcoidia bacterium]
VLPWKKVSGAIFHYPNIVSSTFLSTNQANRDYIVNLYSASLLRQGAFFRRIMIENSPGNVK